MHWQVFNMVINKDRVKRNELTERAKNMKNMQTWLILQSYLACKFTFETCPCPFAVLVNLSIPFMLYLKTNSVVTNHRSEISEKKKFLSKRFSWPFFRTDSLCLPWIFSYIIRWKIICVLPTHCKLEMDHICTRHAGEHIWKKFEGAGNFFGLCHKYLPCAQNLVAYSDH